MTEIKMDSRLAKRLEQKKRKLDRYRPLPAHTVKRLHEHIRLLTTYNSNAIEGNTLSLRETQLVLEYGVTIKGRPVKDVLEASNHAEAFDQLTGMVQKNKITAETVLFLHRVVMEKTNPTAGQLRRVPVYISGSRHRPPPVKDVPEFFRQWLAWTNDDEYRRQYTPIIRAAIAHHGFEALHCFEDGNGRVGRLLLNLMLMQDGYTPALILVEWRVRYLQALSAADAGNYNPLINIIGLAVEQSLDLYLEACEASSNDLLSLPDLAKEFGLATDYLGQLARKGHIAAVKQGYHWYATKDTVQQYLDEVDQEKRGKPRK